VQAFVSGYQFNVVSQAAH